MTAALLFPGQGSEVPGMGAALLAPGGRLRELLERASRSSGEDLTEALLRGGRALARTELAQPALLAVGVAVTERLLASGASFAAVAGHSVGELGALHAAGALAAEEALEVAVVRGRLMGEAAARAPGGMAALRVRSEEEVGEAIALTAGAGRLELAAHNGPEEWVLTGDRAALAELSRHRPTTALPVSGPWHSAAMAPARAAFRAFLDDVPFGPLQLPLVANRDGAWVTPGEDLRELLAAQLTRPVRWAQTLRTLGAFGTRHFQIAGPGRVLRGLCRATFGTSVTVAIDDGTDVADPPSQAAGALR